MDRVKARGHLSFHYSQEEWETDHVCEKRGGKAILVEVRCKTNPVSHVFLAFSDVLEIHFEHRDA